MKYQKGTKLYKVDFKGCLVTLEIADCVYRLKKGAIGGKKFLTEEELDKALKSNEVSLNTDFYKEVTVKSIKEKMKKLQNELDKLEEKYNE